MNETTGRLWLHAHSDPTDGLMVIGSRSSLRALGKQLIEATDVTRLAVPDGNEPVKVAHPPVAGPYSDVSDFNLTFHLEGAAPAPEVLPPSRRSPRPVLVVAVLACALVGVVTIIRWIAASVAG
ncbi:MAG: hypothetical protein H6934_02950 [Burkholderiaceae bacterium]|nr:hypothetical protein [Burkholderiaceae bacterium]